MVKEKNGLKYNAIKNHPVKGVRFIDLTPTLIDATAFRLTTYKMNLLLKENYDYVVATDARGFIWGSALAIENNIPLLTVRKKGKLPPQIVGASITYDTEYSTDCLEIPKCDLTGKRCVFVDDVYATGGTFKASVELVKELGGEIVQGIVVYDVGLNKEKKMYSLFKGADL